MSRFEAWKAAARLHTLPAAIVPVAVGSGLAAGEGAFRGDAFLWTLVGAVAIQVAANFANDVSDAQQGADAEDRIGPPRMVSTGVISPRAMWVGVGAGVAVAAVAGISLAIIAGPLILVIGVASIIAMLGYVGGQVPYGYRGLGEVSVFLFFGMVATVGSRYVHDMTAPLSSWLLAVPVGMLVTAILVVNNYRDIDTDRHAGKRTLAVILGRERTRTLFSLLAYGAFVVIVVFSAVGWTPLTTMFAGLWAPLVKGPIRIVYARTDGPAMIRALRLTSRLHLWTGLALAAGAGMSL